MDISQRTGTEREPRLTGKLLNPRWGVPIGTKNSVFHEHPAIVHPAAPPRQAPRAPKSRPGTPTRPRLRPPALRLLG